MEGGKEKKNKRNKCTCYVAVRELYIGLVSISFLCGGGGAAEGGEREGWWLLQQYSVLGTVYVLDVSFERGLI